jgi:hypothetical protein
MKNMLLSFVLIVLWIPAYAQGAMEIFIQKMTPNQEIINKAAMEMNTIPGAMKPDSYQNSKYPDRPAPTAAEIAREIWQQEANEKPAKENQELLTMELRIRNTVMTRYEADFGKL